MTRLLVGQRVRVKTTRGYRFAETPIAVDGVVESIDVRPWGTDVLVRFDEPALVGNPECQPTPYLSLSLGSEGLECLNC